MDSNAMQRRAHLETRGLERERGIRTTLHSIESNSPETRGRGFSNQSIELSVPTLPHNVKLRIVFNPHLTRNPGVRIETQFTIVISFKVA